jgi:hypothetical protein
MMLDAWTMGSWVGIPGRRISCWKTKDLIMTEFGLNATYLVTAWVGVARVEEPKAASVHRVLTRLTRLTLAYLAHPDWRVSWSHVCTVRKSALFPQVCP